MNICFLVPPAKNKDRIPERVYGCTFTYYRQPELPILYCAALLEQAGHAITVKDFTIDNSWNKFSTFIQNSEFDIFVFHTVLLAESIDIQAARFIIEHRKKVKLIFFGPHPTYKPSHFLLNEQCYVVRGEAEFVIKNLVEQFNAHGSICEINGISFLKNGRMLENTTFGIIQNLDELPIPSRHLLEDRNEYFNPKLKDKPVALTLTSRGCSFRCSFCVPNAISWARELEWKRFHNGNKPPVTLRSAKNIVDEFHIIKTQGYKSVSVIDDMFFFGGKQRILQICEGLRSVGLPFGALARCDLILDEEIVSCLSDAGCKYIDLGIESLNQAILDDTKKDIKVPSIRRAVDLLNGCGIEPKANILFAASPLETHNTISHTAREISKFPLNYCMFSIATPFPGTEFYKQAIQNRWVVEPLINDLENNLSATEKSLVSYPHLKKQEIEKAVKWANRKFYLNPKRLFFQLKQVRSIKNIQERIKTGWKVIK